MSSEPTNPIVIEDIASIMYSAINDGWYWSDSQDYFYIFGAEKIVEYLRQRAADNGIDIAGMLK